MSKSPGTVYSKSKQDISVCHLHLHAYYLHKGCVFTCLSVCC